MFTLATRQNRADAVLVEIPAMIGSFVLAETFYKFHSFSLECGAFLATWLVLGAAISVVRRAVTVNSPEPA